MFTLSDGEEMMTLAFFVLIQYRSVTDGRTDIPPLAIPAVCIARYANALVKSAAGRVVSSAITSTRTLPFFPRPHPHPMGTRRLIDVVSKLLFGRDVAGSEYNVAAA